MSITGKYISCQEILRNVIRDNNYQSQEFSWLDGIEWCSECVEFIAAPKSYIDDISCITIQDYRGLLPVNFHRMTQAAGSVKNSNLFPMRGSTNTFHPVFKCDEPQNILSKEFTLQIQDSYPIGTTINGEIVYDFEGSNTEFTAMPPQTSQQALLIGDATYKLNDNYIFPSFKEGKVYIAYKAFPIDDEGFPRIPDNIRVKKAVETYIRFKLDYRMWRKGDIEDKVYKDSKTESEWYMASAQNVMRIPSIDEMESWKNQCLHLIPRINEHQNFFRGLNQQEQLSLGRRDYYYNGLASTFF